MIIVDICVIIQMTDIKLQNILYLSHISGRPAGKPIIVLFSEEVGFVSLNEPKPQYVHMRNYFWTYPAC